MNANPKTCLACNKPLHGRTDKKFCNDYCRNNYNNQLKNISSNYVRRINQLLLKNRRVLSGYFGSGEEIVKTTKEKLLEQGLQFKYFTHTYTNKKGDTYFFCYEYGYLRLDNNWYLLVKRKEE
jgi:hypothetical protein